MKHTIRLSDTSHVSYPATSSLPPSVIEIILLPASPSSITLEGWGQVCSRGCEWDLSGKKKEKNPGVRYGLYSWWECNIRGGGGSPSAYWFTVASVYSAVPQYHIKETVECKMWYNDIHFVFFQLLRYAVPFRVDRYMRGIVTAAWRWLVASRTWSVCVNHLWPVHVDMHLPLNIPGQKKNY